ncbi:MAG: TolC family protein, partial [Croceibacterium sp.]
MLSFSTRRQLPVLAGVMLVCAAWPACAETAPSFDQLLREAESSPRLALIAAEIERAQGLAIQAQARPNPTVSVMAENFAGGSPYNGFDRAETTVQFSQPIELGGKRAARISAAEAEIIAARARGREGRLAYATELARTYAVADVAKRRVAHAREEVEAAGAVLQLARAVVAAGKEAKLREVQALAELSTRQAALLRAQADLTTALGRLTVLAGAEEPITDIGESLLARLEVPTTIGPPDPLANVAYLAAQAEVAAEAGR